MSLINIYCNWKLYTELSNWLKRVNFVFELPPGVKYYAVIQRLGVNAGK